MHVQSCCFAHLFSLKSSSLSLLLLQQKDATLFANNSQHCWMLHVASFCTFGISREPRTSRSHVIRALLWSSRFNRGSCFTARVFSTLKHNPTFEKKYDFLELFCLVIIEFYFKKFKKRHFEDNFWAKIEVSGWMKTNIAAASYRPRILKSQIWADG